MTGRCEELEDLMTKSRLAALAYYRAPQDPSQESSSRTRARQVLDDARRAIDAHCAQHGCARPHRRWSGTIPPNNTAPLRELSRARANYEAATELYIWALQELSPDGQDVSPQEFVERQALLSYAAELYQASYEDFEGAQGKT